MAIDDTSGPLLLDERSPTHFRALFGDLLSQSSAVDAAILRVRLSAVDLSARELVDVRRLRVLVAEVNAQTIEGEAFALVMDPVKRENLNLVVGLLQKGVMEIRSAPLGGWSPDFTVFSDHRGPRNLLLGLHWFHRPFPHRGPAWAALFETEEAARARDRFQAIWAEAHDIGPAVQRLMERTRVRGRSVPVDTPKAPG